MSARDELQQWVEGTPNTVGVQVDGKIYYSMDVDLARRVLAEMDSGRDELEATRGYAGTMARKAEAAQFDIEDADQRRDDWKSRWQEAVRHADEAFAERDAAQAILAEVRELRDEYRAYLDSGQNQDDPTGIGPLLSVKGVVHALTAILDRSTP